MKKKGFIAGGVHVLHSARARILRRPDPFLRLSNSFCIKKKEWYRGWESNSQMRTDIAELIDSTKNQNGENHKNAEVRYMAGTRPLQNLRVDRRATFLD